MYAMPNSPRVRHHRYHRVLSALKRWKSWANSTEESFASSKSSCPKNTEIALEVEAQIPSENPSLTQDPSGRAVCSMFHLSDITLPCFKPGSWTLTCMTKDWTPTCNRPPGVTFSQISSKTCFLQDTLNSGPESYHQGLTSFLNIVLPFSGSGMFPAPWQRLSDFHRNCPFGVPQIYLSYPPVLGSLSLTPDFNSILKSILQLTPGHSKDRCILCPPTAKLTLTSLSMKSTTKHSPSPAT